MTKQQYWIHFIVQQKLTHYKATIPQLKKRRKKMHSGTRWQFSTKYQTGLGDFTFTFHFHALEKEMATHSSVLAWRIPGTGEPHGLPSMGSHRVRHD